MMKIILLFNLLTALVTSLAGVVALFRPQSLIRSIAGSDPATPAEQFYTRLYAARSIPFGIVAGLLPYLYKGPAVSILLFLAAAIQVGDIFIGIRVKSPRIITGASVATLVHLACSTVLL